LIRGRGRIFKKRGFSPLLDTSNKSERLGAKPPRVGGWEEKDKLKTGGMGSMP